MINELEIWEKLLVWNMLKGYDLHYP